MRDTFSRMTTDWCTILCIKNLSLVGFVASSRKVSALRAVTGSGGCPDYEKLNEVLLDKWRAWHLYEYVRACTNIFQLFWWWSMWSWSREFKVVLSIPTCTFVCQLNELGVNYFTPKQKQSDLRTFLRIVDRFLTGYWQGFLYAMT